MTDALRRRRPAAAGFIFVTMLLDWLVVGIASPVVPKLIVDFRAGDIASASAISGAFATAFALMAFFASPVLGILSDRFGRRPIILLASAGSAIDCAILACAPNLWWLGVGRVLAGATAASATTAAAYIADVSPPEKRAAAFGMVSGAFGLGFALGPALGGLLAGFGIRVPFMVAGGLMVANVAYGLFLLPESLPREQRQASIGWSRANPLGSLRMLRRHRELFGLAASLFCSNLAVQSFSVFVLYTIARFNWSDQANGLGLTLFGSLSVVSAVLVGTLIARFGARNVVLGGFACGSIGFLVYGFAPAGIIFACALPLTGVWAIAGPPIQSAMSRRVAASEQGELQGAIGSVRSIAMVVGPAFFTSLFALVSRHRTSVLIGAPWFCGAAPRCSGGVLPACHSGARTGCDGSRPTRKRGRAARSRLAAWSGAPSRASRPASIEAPAGGRRLHRPRSKTEDTTCITFHAERAGCLRGGTARRRRLQTR